MVEPGDILRRLFAAAVAAADPAVSLARHLPAPPRGRTVVVGAGKAAASMARAVEAAWPGDLSGLVVTRYGHAAPTTRIAVIEAAHPVPDAAGEAASQRILNMVAGLTPDDLVIALISGGGSALLSLPAPGLTLADKQEVNRALLRSGAGIDEMNCVRRHLSAIKGGRLAAACAPAEVVTLLISDIPGDDPLDIASGPTIPDPTSCAEALAILARYRIAIPSSVRAHLETGAGESVKPGDERLGTPNLRMIATPLMALEAAAALATRAGITPLILGDAIVGEAREVGRVMAGIAKSVAAHGRPLAAPCVLLSGGETTVTVRGSGRGGRNVEFLLALCAELAGHPRIHALAGDTDGVDGLEEIAGAILTPDTPARAAALGLSLRASLDRNDGHGFFEALGDGVVTGPTLTNVNDFRAILIV
ncbi:MULTISPECIES: glycerate kinase [unclassified Methylobacterium]|uniref:glycerate kinase type-2 family protein n=1 Tax=unclassified Methylobacterium TaxID=2615210 RepID=UPI0036F588AE